MCISKHNLIPISHDTPSTSFPILVVFPSHRTLSDFLLTFITILTIHKLISLCNWLKYLGLRWKRRRSGNLLVFLLKF